MRKLLYFISIFSLLVVSFPAEAQQNNVSSAGLGQRIMRSLRRVLNQNKVEWVNVIESEVRTINRNGPLGTSFYIANPKSFTQPSAYENKEVFNSRLNTLRKAMASNHTLGTYTLLVPRPNDLINLDEINFVRMQVFFKQPADRDEVNPGLMPQVNQPEKGTVQLTFFENSTGPIFLRVNLMRKEVYFFYSSYDVE